MLPIHVDGSSEFSVCMRRLSWRRADDLAAVEPAVRDIIATVRSTGDGAVCNDIERFAIRVYDVVVRASVIRYSPHALHRDGPHMAAFVRADGLDGHARAVEKRLERSGLSAEIGLQNSELGAYMSIPLWR